jgi:hypothetical protein
MILEVTHERHRRVIRRILIAAAALLAAAGLLVVGIRPAESTVTDSATCSEGSAVTWQGRVIWGDPVGSLITVDHAGWTSAQVPKSKAVASAVKTYGPDGALLQTLSKISKFDFAGGTRWDSQNPVDPPSGPGVTRITITVGGHSDGVTDCTMTFVQPGQPSASPPTATPTPSESPAPSETPTSASPTPTPASSFVMASGGSFMINNQPVRFHGFNAYGMTGCYNGQTWTPAELDAYFQTLPTNGLTRFWAFRSHGVTKVQPVLDAARRNNQRLILTLADGIANCGDTDYSMSGTGSGKNLTYYQTGWQNEWSTWAHTILPLIGPEVAIVETINEPFKKGARPDLATMQTYLEGSTALVHELAPNHLVGVGGSNAADFGSTANWTTLMGISTITAGVSFHDYSHQYEGGAITSSNFTVAKQIATQHGKPFYAGEAGARANVSGCSLTLVTRADHLIAKADAYFSDPEFDALLYWDRPQMYGQVTSTWPEVCRHEMFPDDPATAGDQSDPMIARVKNYTADA